MTLFVLLITFKFIDYDAITYNKTIEFNYLIWNHWLRPWNNPDLLMSVSMIQNGCLLL